MKTVSINPATDEVLGEVEASTEQEIREAAAKSKHATKAWKELGLEKRVKSLRKVIQTFKDHKEELAKLITSEMGMPIKTARSEVDDGINFFNWYLDNASKYLSPELISEDETTLLKVFYEPYGVTAVITPWNYPLSNFVWGSGQNLIVGNCVVYKGSEETPLFNKKLDEVIKSVNLPDGVFQSVYGDGRAGEYLVNLDINLISFTGSSQVGKQLYKAAGEKFIKMVGEFGGCAPGIVFEDADIDQVLDAIYGARFSNCGQMCDALKRLIVHESKFDEVVERLKVLLGSKKVGDPMDEATDIGPLVAERQLKVLEEQVRDALDKGAIVVTGGKAIEGKGNFYQPTILTDVTPAMRVWREEVFGPVLPVVKFSSEEEGVRLANDTSYGLGSYIFTEDKEKALRIASQLETGMVAINNTSYINPCSPFGGYKDSGMGREHGKFGFQELTQVKVVSIPK